ncbi:hypothetical protein PVAND_003652 [Polypedilum vanderplanki]|uniref:Uncharacterized protein n=1 Tax=Polypedilum vanderplanki TaxID=319348 RepID=A0A9J6BUQ5_POLVA|nr:hypothetical protein PVAND_003652 [Polypedilum vanderplanki]
MVAIAIKFSCGLVPFLIFIQQCSLLQLDCRTEKAINHIKNIKDVESYVYNDTHLLNINNKGIKVLKKEIFSYYANRNRDQIEFIYLMYNNINEIEAGSFEEFKNVRNINFGVNLIETIKRNYFQGIEKIDFLNFQSNLIYTIEPGAFDDLTLLEYIYLDDNCLIQIHDHIFRNTIRIRNIFLQNNRLQNISERFMRSNQKLYGLNVADNKLTDISNLLFRFKGLIALTASNNKLNPISDNAISDGNEIVSLNIDNTTLTNINFLRKLKKIRELSAAYNRIRSIDVRQWHGCDELRQISLKNNPLEIIRGLEDVENILPRLIALDVSNSPIESNCFRLLELYNVANDKSLNLNINTTILSACLRS